MTINDVYEKMQESELIQKNRGICEAEIARLVKELLPGVSLEEEIIRDKLYGVAMEAEKTGFASGFRCGVILMLDCFS